MEQSLWVTYPFERNFLMQQLIAPHEERDDEQSIVSHDSTRTSHGTGDRVDRQHDFKLRMFHIR